MPLGIAAWPRARTRIRTALLGALAAGLLTACANAPTTEAEPEPEPVPAPAKRPAPAPKAAPRAQAPAPQPEPAMPAEDQSGAYSEAYSGEGLLPPVLRPYGGMFDGRSLQRRIPDSPLQPPEDWRDSDQRGMASWYGGRFHGRKTASGERFDQGDLTAAHRTLPFGSLVCVRSTVTSKTVVVRINDRGPYSEGRVIDLSQAAAQELGMLGLGIKPVEMWTLAEGKEECPSFVTSPHRKTHASASTPARKKAVVPAKRPAAKAPPRKRR
ncbi:hypothetical protein GCM10027082_10680 [Comamonas humi]